MRPWTIGDVFISKVPVLVIVVALASMFIVHLILRYTLVGKMMRATSDNFTPARVSSIRTRRVPATTWVLSSAIAALGGALLGMKQIALLPVLGWHFLHVMLAAVLPGCIERAYEPMLGSLTV